MFCFLTLKAFRDVSITQHSTLYTPHSNCYLVPIAITDHVDLLMTIKEKFGVSACKVFTEAEKSLFSINIILNTLHWRSCEAKVPGLIKEVAMKCTCRVMSLIILSSTLNYSAQSADVRNIGISLCSEDVDQHGDSNQQWQKPITPKFKHAFKKAMDIYSPIYAAKVNMILKPISKTSFQSIPLSLLEDMAIAAKLSAAIYVNIADGHALSIGADNKPDCVAQYDEETETLWIISRGTKTTSDLLADTSWFTKTAKIGQLDIPVGVVRKCKRIIPNLLEHLDVLAIRKNKVKRICFAGHSLGGAVAIALYLSWNLDSTYSGRTGAKTAAITFGSPLVISNPPKGFCASLSSSSSSQEKSSIGHELAKNVHNIVYQLDIVPRFLGPQPLPTNILEESLKDLVQQLLSINNRREMYRPYGTFYSLRDAAPTWVDNLVKDHSKIKVGGKKNYLIGAVDNPDALLSAFPDSTKDILYGLDRDHCIIRTAESLRAVLRDYFDAL